MEKYESLILEVVSFEKEDVIITSYGDEQNVPT
jgi:hypothetical protein